jgi:hypothetical protein
MVLDINRRNEILKLAREAKARKRMNLLKEKENNDTINIMKVSDGIITYNETQKTLNFTLKDMDTSSTSSNNSNTSNEEPKKRSKYLGCIKKHYLDIPYSKKEDFKENYDIYFDKTNKLWVWEGKKTDMPTALKKRVIT